MDPSWEVLYCALPKSEALMEAWAEWELQTKFMREALPLSHEVQRGCPLLSKVFLREEPECSWIQSEPQTLSVVYV